MMALDYGTCLCTGKYEKRSVLVRMTVEGKLIVLDDVLQGACPLCGSRVYKTDLLACIEATMKRRQIILTLD